MYRGSIPLASTKMIIPVYRQIIDLSAIYRDFSLFSVKNYFDTITKFLDIIQAIWSRISNEISNELVIKLTPERS